MPRCFLKTSMSWKPTVNTGFNELIGSWKIIEISAPRNFCNSPGASARRLRPPYRIWLLGGTIEFSLGSRPRIARAVTDLPLPDSPTSATVLFTGMSKLMPLTAWEMVVLSRRKSTFRSRIPIRMSELFTEGCRSIASLSGDLLEKRLGRRIAAQKLPHHFRGGLLPAVGENQLAETPPDGGIHKVLSVHGQHVERKDLRPHVAIVAGTVAADEVPECAGKLRVGNVACWCFAFHPDPSLHRIDLAFAEKRHVVRGVQMLPGVLDAPAERARRVQPFDQRVIDLRASGAIAADQPQRFLFSSPLFVHLRRCLDKIDFDIGAALARVARPGENPVEDVSELMQQCFQLAVVEAGGVEIGGQYAHRRAPGKEARAAGPESRRVAVLALARKQVEVDPAQEPAGPAVDHVVITHRRMPERRFRRNELDAVHLGGNPEHPRNARIGREIGPQGLLIDVVARLFELFLIVGNVPAVERHLLGALAQALGLERAQFVDFLALELPDLVVDFVEEAVNGFRVSHHAAPGGEMRVARQPVQARDLAAQTRRLAEQV